jgi:trigger factor
VLPEAYEKAAETSGLEIVAQPEIDVEEATIEGGVVFSAVVFSKPEITLNQYKGVSCDIADTSVSDEEINQELERLQERNSRVLTVTDRPSQHGDIITVDFTGYINNEPFEGGQSSDMDITIGSGRFIDTFEEQLIGYFAGDRLMVRVTFPHDYHSEELRGQPAEFDVAIKDVCVKELPVIDDDFAADISEFETISELKDSLRNKLTEAKTSTAKMKKEQDLVDKLVQATHIDVPEVMIKERVDQMIRDLVGDMNARGISAENYFRYTGTTSATLRNNYHAIAEKHVRARLILLEIAKLENLAASEEEINEEIQKFSEAVKIPVDQLSELMSNKEKKELSKDITVRKALDIVVNLAEEQLQTVGKGEDK